MRIAHRRHRLELPAGAVAGIAAAGLALGIDQVVDLPVTVPATNARGLLAASFGALVTAGAFSFWMLPVAAPLAAAAVPPTAVARRLSDRFQRGVIAATLAALAYTAVVVLTLPAAADAAAPTVATVVAALLGVSALAGLLVAIQHAVRSTRPSTLIADAAHEVIDRIRQPRSSRAQGDTQTDARVRSDSTGAAVTASDTGWLTAVDELALLHDLPEGTSVTMEIGLGSFVVRDWTRVATVRRHDLEPPEDLAERLGRHFDIADERSAERDLVSSLTQFTDIAVHAGTGGSSAPSTVYETFWYLGAILHELAEHELGVIDRELEGGRALEWVPDPGAAVLAGMTVDRIRQVTASQPTMALELVRVLSDARRHAASAGRHELLSVLDEQTELTVAQCRHAGPLPADLERVVEMSERTDGGRGAEREEEYPTEPPEPATTR